LGTVATRPAIMENLIDRGYIFQEQKVLKPTGKGSELIRLIKERLPQAQLLISAEMTGQMEFNLSRVEKGELSIESYMADVENAIRLIIQELRSFEAKYGKSPLALAPSERSKKADKGEGTIKDRQKESKVQGSKKEVRGTLTEGNSNEANSVGGNSSEGEKSIRKNLTEEEGMQTKKKRTSVKKALKSKVVDEDNSQETPARATVVRSISQAEVLGICPRCAGNVIEGQKGYGCANWRNGCRFIVWKSAICGKVLSPNQIKSLLKKGKTPLIKGFKSKTGKAFAAYLIWEDRVEGKLKFEFEESN
ncbi:MAG: topoisomerase C-terminal repeat-containing protein, partial [Desulfitobacteriaceae bacterium]